MFIHLKTNDHKKVEWVETKLPHPNDRVAEQMATGGWQRVVFKGNCGVQASDKVSRDQEYSIIKAIAVGKTEKNS